MKNAVQIILINEKNQVLGVSRKDNHKDFGLPGGKQDPEDASPEAAIIREVKEETGLDVTNLRLIFAMHRWGYMGYTYLADYSGTIHTDEPHIVKWVDYVEVMAGSFGKWNKMVLESLRDMGIKIKLYPDPKNKWFFTTFPDQSGGFHVAVCTEKFYKKNGHCPDRFSDRDFEELHNIQDEGEISLGEAMENCYDVSFKGEWLRTRKEIDTAMIAAGFIKDEKFYDEFSQEIKDGVEEFTGKILGVVEEGIRVEINTEEGTEEYVFTDPNDFKNVNLESLPEIKIRITSKDEKPTMEIWKINQK